MEEITEQLAFVAGVEFGDAFNCVRLGEYTTYEGEPYRDTVVHYEHQLATLDEQIAETPSANKKKALRTRGDALINSHAVKSEAAIRAEDIGRMLGGGRSKPRGSNYQCEGSCGVGVY